MHINASAFKATNFRADYLNGLPVEKLFTLKTNQTFEHEIKILGCLEVGQLVVHGPVNGFSIEKERANTVMVSRSLYNVVQLFYVELSSPFLLAERKTSDCDS